MENWQRAFLKKLDEALEGYRVDSIFLESDGENPDTMREMFDVGGGEMIAPIVMDQAIFEVENGRYLLNIFTEVALNVDKSDELLDYINRLNLSTAIGAFGYCEEQRDVYHKYNLLIEEPDDIEDLVRKDLDILDVALMIIGNYYKELHKVAKKIS